MALKSKRQRKKELRIKREFRHVLRMIDKGIMDVEKDIAASTKFAAECKQSNSKQHYEKALYSLSISLNARAKYLSLKLDFQTAMNLRNNLATVGAFSDAMVTWGKSIAKISKEFNIDAAIASIENASEILEEKNEELAEMTDTISDSFGSIANSSSQTTVSNEEAIRLVEGYIATGSQTTGSTSNYDIDRIREMLDKGNKNE